VANQLSDVLRCSFQIANLGDRTSQRCGFWQLLEEGFNQCLPLLEGEALGCGDKFVNGHYVYSFASCTHRLEYNTPLGVEGDSFPPQAAAAYFHRYGLGRDDVDDMLETFPIVKRKDEQAHGEYYTKRVILDIYDAIHQAMETGTPYHTRLDPPPAHGWTPPEITLETVPERQGDGAKEDSAANSLDDLQRRASISEIQPKLHFASED
jgi:hypothetical protein